MLEHLPITAVVDDDVLREHTSATSYLVDRTQTPANSHQLALNELGRIDHDVNC
jgi:hypothetical protein